MTDAWNYIKKKPTKNKMTISSRQFDGAGKSGSYMTIISEDSSMVEESLGSFQFYREWEIQSVKPRQLVGNCQKFTH